VATALLPVRPSTQRTWPVQVVKSVVVAAVVAIGLWAAIHHVAGVTLGDVVATVHQVAPGWFVGLGVVWIGGLVVYATVLVTALPGLSLRRGILLNLSGSAVSNLMPMGGAVGTAVNWRMVTRWGHSTTSFTAFCVLTNVLDVLTKLVFPALASGLLLAVSVPVPGILRTVTWCCLAGAAGLLLLVYVVPRLAGVPTDTSPSPRGTARLLAQARLQARDTSAHFRQLWRDSWPRLLLGSVGYLAAQVALLYGCLAAVSVHAPIAVVVMAAAVERLATLVPITPGGAGVAELGAVAWLSATGLDPTHVVAGVVICRLFLVAMEVPVGGALLVCWLWTERRAAAA
jgi:putative heme transporter